MVSLDPMGDSTKLAGHSPSDNLLKYEQNFKRRDVKKGGPNIKGRSAMELGPPCPPFLKVFLKCLFDYFFIILLNPREYQWRCQPIKSIFSLSVLKDSVGKIQNN